jgi:mannose-6-phosphate isomerase-like protein (cupin superfamily)
MERRDFILKSGLLTAFGMVAPASFAMSQLQLPDNSLKAIAFPPLPPLDHKGGMDIRVWIRSSMTNGAFSNVETAVAPRTMGPPPHWHLELDEIMYVVEGTASVLVKDEVVEIPAGGWHLRPRMIKHTFFNAQDKPLRFFDMYFNQPFEEYLEKIFHEFTEENGYKEGSEKKSNAIAALNKQFGLIFPEDAFTQYADIVKQYGLK